MADFVHEIPVRFADVDRAGILYYPRFLNYFHIAFEEFSEAVFGVPYHETIQRERVGFPMVHLEIDFKSPLTYGDRAQVAIRVVKVGRSSVEYVYEVKSRNSGKVTTLARAVTAAVNLDTFQTIPVPEPYRARLLARIEK